MCLSKVYIRNASLLLSAMQKSTLPTILITRIVGFFLDRYLWRNEIKLSDAMNEN